MMLFLKQHKIITVLLCILIFIILLIIFALIFMRAFPSFGGRPTKADRENYSQRAEGYYDREHFIYPAEWVIDGVSADNRVSKKDTVPKEALPTEAPDFAKAQPDDVAVTWLGHSSLLIQWAEKTYWLTLFSVSVLRLCSG